MTTFISFLTFIAVFLLVSFIGLDRLLIKALHTELLDQWETNHIEHCGRTWPHPEGTWCGWPRPSVLTNSLVETS